MASTTLTGSYSGSSASVYAIRCVCSSTPNNTSNTSNVTVTLQMRRVQGAADGGNWQWNLTGGATGRIIINGTDSGNRSVTFDTRYNIDWITLTSYTVNNIAHNADGTKSINIKAYFEPNATASLSGGKVDGTFVLDTIPRATTPTFSATTVTMGSSITITMTPASSGFKHKIRYSFGTLTGQTSGLSIGANFSAAGTTTATFTPPTSLANKIPSANSGTCTIYCYTYNSSGTQIGSTVSKTITLNVPTYSLTGSIALTGDSLLSGVYVQGKSKVKATITASSSYGATIKSYSSTVDGKKYTGQTFTSSTLSNGSKTVSTTITDSRNKTVTVTSSTITVYPYSAPYVTSLNVERQSDGTTVKATLVGGVSSVNSKNAKTFKVTLNGVTNTLTSTAYTINASTTFTNVPTDSTFTATATITDSYTSKTKTAVVPTVSVTMDFYKDGKGVAFGKVAETTDLLDVAWSERVRKNLTVDGTLSATGNVTMGGTLSVTGAATLNKASTISDDVFPVLTLKRNHEKNASGIKFQNNSVVLGYIGMTGNATNAKLTRWASNGSTTYTFLDTESTKDYIVEQGSTGIWDYCKWNNGDAECWGNLSITPTTVNGTNSSTVNLPFEFIDTAYKVYITPAKTALYIGPFGDCNSSNNISHTTASFVMSYKYNYATAYNVSFNLVVKGKWK